MANSTENTKYFDLHINGLGYLNRVRTVPVQRGKPFLAVDVTALHGAADAVEKTYFDCRVSGAEAQKVIEQLRPDLEADAAVLVGFRLGDLYAEPFTYKSGKKAGQTGVSLKARLLFITWAKVDGREVYRAPEKEPVEPATATPAAVETPRAPQGPASASAASAETPQAPVRSTPKPAPRPSRPPVDPEQEEAREAAELFYDEEDIFGGPDDVFSHSGETTNVFET